MTWSKSFVRAKIKPVKGVWVATITYSYYGLYHYPIIEHFETKVEAEHWVLQNRCDGHLVIEDE